MPSSVAVVGLAGLAGPAGAGAALGPAPAAALAGADLVVAGRRQLAAVAAVLPEGVRTAPIDADVTAVLDAVAAEPGRVCVLASGDPGFFGIVRPLAERFGRNHLEVHPAPSSVSLAFARLGLPWDDAVVVSAHGRPLPEAVARAAGALRAPNAKVAVLTSPDSPPEAVGAALMGMDADPGTAAVCSRLGEPGETCTVTDLAGLAAGRFDPLSVVVLFDGDGVPSERTLAWGLPAAAFAHRAGMITKGEVRAVVLGKLALPAAGVLWDVGAGSASVAVECARLAPGLDVSAVERDPDLACLARRNVRDHGVAVRVLEGSAPKALDALPPPDRVFVGGGGLSVLDAVLDRLRPRGRVVATYAAMDRAAAAADRLGSLVSMDLARGVRLPDGGLRLAAENPVFVVWGPDGDSAEAVATEGAVGTEGTVARAVREGEGADR
ncbi:MAG TPA: precorrin-6y C5,15-methyltransferase (decarboxylating) subunit CbiE [Acidimicrobiales bacterium]|nr:precorrin-6y C5,15-methyltransferase (decarboxylating) subunit CbiE [Acidimicrobiales bacterium]